MRCLPEYYRTLLGIWRKCSGNRITTVPGFREEAMTEPLWGKPTIAVNGNPPFCLSLARQGYHTFGDLFLINPTFLRRRTLLNYRAVHAELVAALAKRCGTKISVMCLFSLSANAIPLSQATAREVYQNILLPALQEATCISRWKRLDSSVTS